jgi:DNA-binding beta-propeller fold protein YncE
MPTTTATITLSSSDLLTDNLSLSSTMTLYQDGTTATGLDEVTYSRHNIPTGTNFDLIPESAALTEDASYVYIANKSTDVTYYVIISINDEVIGRLYAGDWMFMPWDCDLSAAANDSSIECQAYTGENIIEYALFHNGETLLTAADS